MRNRLPIYAILSGILLVISSCVPVAHTLYRLANPEPPDVFQLSPDGRLHTQLPAAGSSELILSLALELAAGEFAAYAVDYEYALAAAGGAARRGTGAISESGTGPGYSIDRRAGSVFVEQRFPALVLAPGEAHLTLDVEIDGPHSGGAVLIGAQARVYRDPPRFTISFIGIIVVWTLGILLALSGSIQWIRGVATTPPSVDAGKDTDMQNARVWTMWCHLSALVGYILPFGHIVFPAVVWMARRDRVEGVDAAGRESLNFQLTMTLFTLVGVLLSVVFVGLVLLFAVVVFHVSMTLRASLRAQRGLEVRYPLNIRLIKPAGQP